MGIIKEKCNKISLKEWIAFIVYQCIKWAFAWVFIFQKVLEKFQIKILFSSNILCKCNNIVYVLCVCVCVCVFIFVCVYV